MSNPAKYSKREQKMITYKINPDKTLDKELQIKIIDNLESVESIIKPIFIKLEIGEGHTEEGILDLIEGFKSENIELRDFRYSEDYSKLFFEVV